MLVVVLARLGVHDASGEAAAWETAFVGFIKFGNVAVLDSGASAPERPRLQTLSVATAGRGERLRPTTLLLWPRPCLLPPVSVGRSMGSATVDATVTGPGLCKHAPSQEDGADKP